MCVSLVFFFKQKTAYEMRISDWSSDVCSSDLRQRNTVPVATMAHDTSPSIGEVHQAAVLVPPALPSERHESVGPLTNTWPSRLVPVGLPTIRSEEHTSELQSLMRISYAVFCLQKKIKYTRQNT